jgi:hypothetical protein
MEDALFLRDIEANNYMDISKKGSHVDKPRPKYAWLCPAEIYRFPFVVVHLQIAATSMLLQSGPAC